MKTIRTTYGISIEEFYLPTEKLSNELMDALFEPVYKNKIKVFETAGTIERYLDMIIAKYFYGGYSETNKDFINRFNSLILSSDWCSFAMKRKRTIHIVNEFKLLEGKEKEEFDKLL